MDLYSVFRGLRKTLEAFYRELDKMEATFYCTYGIGSRLVSIIRKFWERICNGTPNSAADNEIFFDVFHLPSILFSAALIYYLGTLIN